MKNILLAINPDKPVLPCIQFGCYLAQLTQSRLTAVFLETILVPIDFPQNANKALSAAAEISVLCKKLQFVCKN